VSYKICRQRYLPASDLRLSTHFKKVALNQAFTGDDAADLATRIQTFLTNSKRFCELSVIPAVARCEADVMENLGILKTGIRNEAELHFAIADPILRLLCSERWRWCTGRVRVSSA